MKDKIGMKQGKIADKNLQTKIYFLFSLLSSYLMIFDSSEIKTMKGKKSFFILSYRDLNQFFF